MKPRPSAAHRQRPDFSTVRRAFEAGLFAPPTPDTAQTLFAPEHYEPNYAYPLLVWLHESGDDEWQLLRVMPSISLRNYVAVAPRGLLLHDRRGEAAWGWTQRSEHVDRAEGRIFEAIAAAGRKYHVHPHRVFLVGAGEGGTMALRIAACWPDRFAGVASLGGPLPEARHAPLSRWNEVRRLPFLISAGRQAPDYPTARACDDVKLLGMAGVASVTLREYHPCECPVVAESLRDVNRWIMDLVTR